MAKFLVKDNKDFRVLLGLLRDVTNASILFTTEKEYTEARLSSGFIKSCENYAAHQMLMPTGIYREEDSLLTKKCKHFIPREFFNEKVSVKGNEAFIKSKGKFFTFKFLNQGTIADGVYAQFKIVLVKNTPMIEINENSLVLSEKRQKPIKLILPKETSKRYLSTPEKQRYITRQAKTIVQEYKTHTRRFSAVVDKEVDAQIKKEALNKLLDVIKKVQINFSKSAIGFYSKAGIHLNTNIINFNGENQAIVPYNILEKEYIDYITIEPLKILVKQILKS